MKQTNMRRIPLDKAKECTTCDICGGRLVIPPGVVYRGKRMHKNEYEVFRRQDFCSEVKGPALAGILKEVEETLR